MKLRHSNWRSPQVDKGIPVPEIYKKKNKKAYDFLETLEIGDSFVVEDSPDKMSGSSVYSFTQMGKKLGMKLVTRKIYSEDNPKDYHYRVWYTEKIDPSAAKKPENQRKPYDVVHRQDPAIGNFDAETGRLPNDILFLAEQNEENREIVEDIRRLNRILIEELGKQNLLPKQGE